MYRHIYLYTNIMACVFLEKILIYSIVVGDFIDPNVFKQFEDPEVLQSYLDKKHAKTICLLEQILENKVGPNDCSYLTPHYYSRPYVLNEAVKRSRMDIVEYMLLSIRSYTGYTQDINEIFIGAVESGSVDMVKLFLNGQNRIYLSLQMFRKTMYDCLNSSKNSGNLQMIKLLIDNKHLISVHEFPGNLVENSYTYSFIKQGIRMNHCEFLKIVLDDLFLKNYDRLIERFEHYVNVYIRKALKAESKEAVGILLSYLNHRGISFACRTIMSDCDLDVFVDYFGKENSVIEVLMVMKREDGVPDDVIMLIVELYVNYGNVCCGLRMRCVGRAGRKYCMNDIEVVEFGV